MIDLIKSFNFISNGKEPNEEEKKTALLVSAYCYKKGLTKEKFLL